MNKPTPEISVIIASFNTRDLLRECLTQLMEQASALSTQIIVVDNASRDGSADMVAKEFPAIELIRSEVNLGFAGANNLGFQRASGRYVVLLNSDAFMEPGVLARSVELMKANPRVGLAGGALIGRDGSWQASARMYPSVLNEFLSISGLSCRFARSKFFGRQDRTWAPANQPASIDWVPGAYSIISREALEAVGYFDEQFFLYYEEVDLCHRIKNAGFEIWYWPELRIVHLGGESSKTITSLSMSKYGSQLTLWRMRSEFLYYRKYNGVRAIFALWVEEFWHRLRLLKVALQNNDETKAKSEYSRQIIGLLHRAWAETHGGRISPVRPW